MFTNLELKTKIANLVQRSNDAAYIAKIQDWLNFAQDYAYREYDYYAELEADYIFSTVIGQEAYYLPVLFSMPYRIYNRTNGQKLTIITEESYKDSNLSSIVSGSTGSPEFARLYGVSPVAKTISGPITLKAKSSLSSDTSSIVIRAEGYVDSALSILGYDTITINTASPTTYTAASGGVQFYGFTKIAKSGDTNGYITIADNNSNILATIMPNERASRYQVLRLGLIPDAVYSVEVLFKQRTNRMVNDNDYPFIDADEFFVNYAYAYCLSEEKENVERVPQIFSKSNECLMAVIRNEQSRLGEDFQHKIIHKMAQAFRT